MTTAGDITDFFDEIMPFSEAEEWDNSGLLVGSRHKKVKNVLTCLDITANTVREAKDIHADMIISHHPVIFEPLRSVPSESVVYKLIENNISALCCHTNADRSDCGTNTAAFELLETSLSLKKYEKLPSCGWKAFCSEISPDDLAKKLSEAFGVHVKYTDSGENITEIYFCSGAGGFLIDEINEKSSALVTGEIKHNILVEAENKGVSVFDCTHYSTEILFAEKTKKLLSERFADLSVKTSETGRDYIKTV